MKFQIFFVFLYFVTSDFYVKSYELSELTNTTPEEFPYHAVVHGKLVCNGILISENFIVTPAYCVYGATTVTVYLGFKGYPYYTSNHKEPNTQIFYSKNIYIHEDFAKIKDQHYLNNIALIKLDTPATLCKKIQPGKLISREEAQLIEGRSVNISGWLVSQDTSVKFATLRLRNEDTCSYLFGPQFLRSQQICVKWKIQNRLNLLGNAVSMGHKIIGFQTNTPSCTVASSSCTRNDMVLYLVPFLDWISSITNIPVSKFTCEDERNRGNIDLTKIEDIINIIKQTKTEYEQSIADLRKKVEDIITETQQIKSAQKNYTITLNEELGSMKTEIINNRKQEDKNIFSLQEEMNGMKTEISSGLSAQRILADIETKVKNQSDNIENIINAQLKELKKQFENLSIKTENNEIKSNMKLLQYKDNITSLYDQIFELNKRFELINATTEYNSADQRKLFKRIEDIKYEFLVYQTQQKESLTELKEGLHDDIHNIEKSTVKQNIRFDNIESLFTEQRNHLDKHVVQEKAEIYSLWTEIKSLKASITQLLDFVDSEPVPR